ncbi:MAG: thymidine kinase [Bacilli bacterium]|nr:thymidine kinase [Bacilli bacterium]
MASLSFRYGAMNCGKTTALLQVAHNYEENGLQVIVIKSEKDTKGDDAVISRLGKDRKVDFLIKEEEKLLPYGELWKQQGIACVLVDEAEFLSEEQVIDLYRITKYYDIPVICYSLRTTFKAKFFTGSNPLMRWADHIEELINICGIKGCGQKAKFQGRKVNGVFVLEGEEVVIDGSDSKTEYVPLCGEHYLQEVYDKNRILDFGAKPKQFVIKPPKYKRVESA